MFNILQIVIIMKRQQMYRIICTRTEERLTIKSQAQKAERL